MFIGNNFHRNSSFNYKNSGNKALTLRFGCDENGPCKPIKEVKDLLISKKADPEKTDLFFKFLLLSQKRNGIPHKETVKDLVESINSDPECYVEDINNTFDTKSAEKYIELYEVDPLDKAKELLNETKVNPKKANIFVDTMFKLYNNVLEMPYQEAAYTVLELVKSDPENWKTILVKIPIKQIPERFIIAGEPEQLEKRLQDISETNAISKSKKPERHINMLVRYDSDQEIMQKDLIHDMTQMLKPYNIKLEQIEIFVGQALSNAEKEDIPFDIAIFSLSTLAKVNPERMAKNIKDKHRMIKELKYHI